MADEPDHESRTEAPTEKKLRDSLEKGNAPLSREASPFATLVGFLLIGVFVLPERTLALALYLGEIIDHAAAIALRSQGDAVSLMLATTRAASVLLVPCLAILTLSGLLAGCLQGPLRIATDRVRPKLSRLSLGSGWERIFGGRGRIEIGKSLLKLSGVTLLLGLVLVGARGALVDLLFVGSNALPGAVLTIVVKLTAGATLLAFALVAADVAMSRAHWLRDLKMTKQEVKDEHKEMEGNPFTKSRFRALAARRSRQHMLTAVPRATLVIANPTHYAIALRYVREENSAPVVVAKGRDLLALKMREIAEANRIPVVDEKLLARSMYDVVEVNQMIPAAFYKAVAEIVHFLRSRDPSRKTGDRRLVESRNRR